MCDYVKIATTEQAARKQHGCTWCGQKIQIGERYTRDRCVVSGGPQSNKYHMECWEALNEAVRYEGGHCLEFSPGENERPVVSP